MKVIVLIGLLSPFSLLASELPQFNIQALKGGYLQDRGQASASYWKTPDKAAVIDAKFSVVKEQDSFLVTGNVGEFTLEDTPELLLGVKRLDWSEASFQSTEDSINLSLGQLNGADATQSVIMQRLKASCQGTSSSSSLRDVIIETCLKKGSVSLPLIELTSNKSSVQWIKSFFSTIEIPQLTSQTRIENIGLVTSNGAFSLFLRANLSISANIKVYGRMDLKKESGRTELRLRLDKAKASFFTITNKVFEAIENSPVNGIRVERPYVIVDLGPSQ